MEKIWNITIDFLAKINTWIPLVSILWAGAGLVGIVLILAITGCALRKRLVPQWLIWGYFTFAAMIIFAQANNDIFKVVAYLEVPFLVVLFCYFLRMLFYRRPRYTYVERSVNVRQVAKRSKKEAATATEVPVVNPVANFTFGEEDENEDESLNIDNAIVEAKTEVIEEPVQAEEVVEDVNEEKEEVVESPIIEESPVVNEDNKVAPISDFFGEEESIVEEIKAEEPVTMDLPAIEPIPEKIYEAPREPEVVKPVTETVPNFNTFSRTTSNVTARPTTNTFNRTTSTTSSLFGTRPTTATATRPTMTTTARPTTTTASATRPTLKPYASMLGTNRTAATTSTTTNTAASMTRPATSLGTNSTTAKPRSTDEIMAAIERLRASMKK